MECLRDAVGRCEKLGVSHRDGCGLGKLWMAKYKDDWDETACFVCEYRTASNPVAWATEMLMRPRANESGLITFRHPFLRISEH